MARFWIALIVLLLPGMSWASTTCDSVPKRTLIQKVMNYLSLENDIDSANHKRVQFSLLGGPSYASDSKFSLNLMGILNYRLNGCDSIQPSIAMIKGAVTTAGFWSAGVEGTMYFPGESKRLNYRLICEYAPRDFWGIGYDNAISDRKTKLHQRNIRIKSEMLFRVANHLYVGPMMQFDYANSGKIEDIELLGGQDRVVRNYGVGLTLQYDSRDLPTNAYSGVYMYLNQMFRPRFLWNDYAFSTTDFQVCYYHKAWRGAVVAGQATALLNYGNPSWAMMAMMGYDNTMRGYYMGRYRDRHMITAQVELRQHLFWRLGAVFWGGAGSVFHDSDSFKHWVPNYGVGIRWEFRRRINISLDYGFGHRGINGFMFGINEAF